MVNAGLRCPMCNSKEFHYGYHDHQRQDSGICDKCGIHWQEDTNDREIWQKWEDYKINTPEELVKELTYYRKNRPAKEGMYKGLPFGGFVWVLHKTGDFNPVQDSRSSDEVDFKGFGRNPKNLVKKK